jgi:hypothetical protein
MSEYKNCPVCGANDWRPLDWLSALPDRVCCAGCGTIIHKDRINCRVLEWVPVGERLPDVSREYYCKIEIEGGMIIFNSVYFFAKTKKWGNGYYPRYDTSGNDDEQAERICSEYSNSIVTHWLDDRTWEVK